MKLNKMRCIFALSSFVLTSCAVSVSHQDGKDAVPELHGYRMQTEHFDSTGVLDAQWWQLYDDPALNEIISEVLLANKTLAVAQANLAKAYSVLKEVDNQRFPSTQLQGGVSYGDAIPNTGMNGGQEQWSEYGGVSWEVDLFGRVADSIEVANLSVQAQEALRDGVRVQVVAQATQAYMDACAASYALSVAQQGVDVSHHQWTLAQQKQQAGTGLSHEVALAQGRYLHAQAEIPIIEARRQNALLTLTTLMGRVPEKVPDTASRCDRVPTLTQLIPIGDAKQLLRRRPDLREAELQFNADAKRVDVLAADAYPQVKIGADLNYLNTEAGTNDGFAYSLGPLLSWRFPNLGAVKARVAQAEAQEAVAFEQLQLAILNALQEVEQSLSQVTGLAQRQQSLAASRKQYQQAFDIAQMRYQLGSSDYLTVLDAQNALLNVKREYAESEQQLAQARITLFKSLGGGWETYASHPTLFTQNTDNTKD